MLGFCGGGGRGVGANGTISDCVFKRGSEVLVVKNCGFSNNTRVVLSKRLIHMKTLFGRLDLSFL